MTKPYESMDTDAHAETLGGPPMTLSGLLLVQYPVAHDVLCNRDQNADLFAMLRTIYDNMGVTDGSRDKLDEDAADYPTEESKIKYAASRLNGTAAAMVAGIPAAINKKTPFIEWQWQTLEDMLKSLSAVYDKANEVKDADDELTALEMGSLSWPEFYGFFCQHHALLKYDDASKVGQLAHKVSSELANAAALQVPAPADDDLPGWVRLYSTLFDNQQRLKNRNGSRGGNMNNGAGNGGNNNRGSSNPNPGESDAMEIDKINSILQRGGRKTINIKTYRERKQNNLCHGCGEPNHLWRDCPQNNGRGGNSEVGGNGQGRGRGGYGGWQAYNNFGNGRARRRGGYGGWQAYNSVGNGGGFNGGGSYAGAPAGGSDNNNNFSNAVGVWRGGDNWRGCGGRGGRGGFQVNHVDFGFGPVAFNPWTGEPVGSGGDTSGADHGVTDVTNTEKD